MFTLDELKQIGAALVLQEKSVMRLSQKEGQPESVAAEYRKVAGVIAALLRKVSTEQDKLAQVKK